MPEEITGLMPAGIFGEILWVILEGICKGSLDCILKAYSGKI